MCFIFCLCWFFFVCFALCYFVGFVFFCVLLLDGALRVCPTKCDAQVSFASVPNTPTMRVEF